MCFDKRKIFSLALMVVVLFLCAGAAVSCTGGTKRDVVSDSDMQRTAGSVTMIDFRGDKVTATDWTGGIVTATDTEPDVVTATDTAASTTAAAAVSVTTTALPVQESDGATYQIVVYRGSQSVVVYSRDENGAYSVIVRCFTCSTGDSSSPTRTGSYRVKAKYRWRYLMGGVYGQYGTSISATYLFHSVPYYQQDASTLENEEYDKLGMPASKGCIRMCVRDCKWIYDNIPIGTQVKIVAESGPAGPGVPKRSADPAFDGWDPTDRGAQGSPYFNQALSVYGTE